MYKKIISTVNTSEAFSLLYAKLEAQNEKAGDILTGILLTESDYKPINDLWFHLSRIVKELAPVEKDNNVRPKSVDDLFDFIPHPAQ